MSFWEVGAMRGGDGSVSLASDRGSGRRLLVLAVVTLLILSGIGGLTESIG